MYEFGHIGTYRRNNLLARGLWQVSDVYMIYAMELSHYGIPARVLKNSNFGFINESLGDCKTTLQNLMLDKCLARAGPIQQQLSYEYFAVLLLYIINRLVPIYDAVTESEHC